MKAGGRGAVSGSFSFFFFSFCVVPPNAEEERERNGAAKVFRLVKRPPTRAYKSARSPPPPTFYDSPPPSCRVDLRSAALRRGIRGASDLARHDTSDGIKTERISIRISDPIGRDTRSTLIRRARSRVNSTGGDDSPGDDKRRFPWTRTSERVSPCGLNRGLSRAACVVLKRDGKEGLKKMFISIKK